MIDLPMRAFCLMGNDGKNKIELTIDEVFWPPELSSDLIEFTGGYEFKGTLMIHVGSYKVHNNNFFSRAKELCCLYNSLVKCYSSLEGMTKYTHMYDEDLEIEIKMTRYGHAIIDGKYTEYPHLPNTLTFQIETDQSCIRCAIDDLGRVERLLNK